MEVSSKSGDQIDTVLIRVFSCLRRVRIFYTKNI